MVAEREIRIIVKSDNDTFHRFKNLVKDLCKKNLDGELIKDIQVLWRCVK